MSKWDIERFSAHLEVEEALSQSLDFKVLAEKANLPLADSTPEAEGWRDYIYSAASEFVRDCIYSARDRKDFGAKYESRLYRRILTATKAPLNSRKADNLQRLLEEAYTNNVYIPWPIVERFPDRNPKWRINNLEELHKRAAIISEMKGEYGARNYLAFKLFAQSLYRVYRAAGGKRRYTYDQYKKLYSGEAVDFIDETVKETERCLPQEDANIYCPLGKQRQQEIAHAVRDYGHSPQVVDCISESAKRDIPSAADILKIIQSAIDQKKKQ